MKDIEKILAPFDFSFGKKQDLGTLLIHLKKNDVSTDEVIQYLTDLREKGKKERAKIALRFCPDCKAPMQIFSVNDKPETQTGDPTDRSVWMCPNKACLKTIYNKETRKKLLRELLEKEQ